MMMMGITGMFAQETNHLYPKVKRLEGQGNGGNWLELSESTRNSIMAGAPWKVQQPEYTWGTSPVVVRVTNPAELQPYEYRLGILPVCGNDVSLIDESAHWKLQWYDQDGALIGAYYSQYSIGEGNEESIPGHGIAITVKNHPFSIHDKYLALYVNNHGGKTYQNNAWYAQPDLIGSQVTYNGAVQWLDGLNDAETSTPDNWIRAGHYKSTWSWECNSVQSNMAGCDYTKWRTEDCFNLYNNNLGGGSYTKSRGFMDYYGQFEHVAQGTWAPYVLSSPYDGGPKAKYLTEDVAFGSNEPTPSYYSFQNLSTLLNTAGYNQTMTNLYSVDIVFTPDTSLWTRALVLESGSETAESNYNVTQHFNGQTYQNIRHEPKHCPSVDKNGNPDNSGTTGFGWFPGYAINVETGERLNIMFAENSEDEYNHGNDMIFNPTNVYAFQKDNNGNYILGNNGKPIPMSQEEYNMLYSSSVCNHETLGEPLNGGRHYVYVCGSSGNTANTYYRFSDRERNYNDYGQTINVTGYVHGGAFVGSDGISYPYYECGVYDEGKWLREKFNTLTELNYNATARKAKKMQVFNNVMWTGIPMPAEGQESDWLANDATVSIRVSRPYMYYSSEAGSGPDNSVNENAPLFSFTTSDLNIAQTHNLYDLSEYMANNDNRININNIDAPISPFGGGWFFDGDGTISDLHITDNYDKQTLFDYSFWMGGLDNGNQLHLFGEQYRLNGYDTWPGPLSTVNASIDEETMLQWSRTFKITRREVLEFMANYQNPDYVIPQHIRDWPAHGDTTKGQAWLLAPFTDMDGDNHYDPTHGDHPDFPGDMAQFVIFNDNYAQHGESQGAPMGVETHVMVYAFDAPEDSVMNNTIFFNYKVFNRSQNDYHDTYIGLYCDWDLGYAFDDYVGVDIGWNSAYCYNGTETDGSGQSYAWGENWPVQTLTLLTGPYMPADSTDNPAYTDGSDCSAFINNGQNEYAINGTAGFGDGIVDNERYGLTGFTYHNNDNSVTGPPHTAAEYYNMIHGFWKENTHVKYGGNGHPSNGSSDIDCRFMFPGNSGSCDYNTYGVQIPQNQQYGNDGWTESAAGNTPQDRRGLASVGPFNLASGDMQELDLCMVTIPHSYAVTPNGITLDSLYRVNPQYRSQNFVTPIVHNIYETICQGDSLDFFGTYYEKSGLYSHHVPNATHSNEVADTVYCLHLTVSPPYTVYEVSACDGFIWNDSTYTVSGDYFRSFTTVNGCDSTVMLRLTILNTNSVDSVTVICSDYYWHGQAYYETGTYTYEYTNENGCVCTDTLYLTELPAYGEVITIFACDSFTLNGITYTESGTYTQYTDSMLVVHITWMYGHWGYYDETDGFFSYYRPIGWSDLYSKGIDEFGNEHYAYTDQDGIEHSYTLGEVINISNLMHNIPTCKVIMLNLTINPFVETIEATACDSYTWNGVTYTESGDYTLNSDTTLAIVRNLYVSIDNGGEWGYDDADGNFIYLRPSGWSNLKFYGIDGTYYYYYTDQHGANHFYNLGDIVPYTDTVPACKTTTLHLIVNESKNTETTAGSCDSYTWNDSTYTTSGDYTQTFTAANGCDSVVTLHLTILPSPTPAITGVTTVCEGQTATLTATGGMSYLWEDGTATASFSTTESGVYTVTVTNANGCSATASATVTVNPLPEVAVTGNTYICPGGSTVLTATGAATYMWSNGSTNAAIPVNAFGQYSVIGTSAEGCFSTASVTVLVSQPPVITISGNTNLCTGESTTLTATGGVSYMWSNGSADSAITVNTAGNWQVIGYNENNCSNMASVTVNVWQPAATDLYITSFDSCYTWFGTPRCESGDYTHTLQTIHGCDSVITLHLTLEDAIVTEFSATACDSYMWNGATYSQSGNYTQSFTAVNGNDSIVTLHLTVNPSVQVAFADSTCTAYVWNGQTYAASGDYIQTFTAVNGCDSVVTLHLTVNHSTAGDTTAIACESFSWHGNTYTQSGNYTHTMTNAVGCDSVVTLHLTVNQTVAVTDTRTVCASELPIVWNGVQFAGAGTQTANLQTANGCDSVVTMTLTVNHPTAGDTTAVACESFSWHGNTYTQSGNYTYTTTNVAGCDSVVTLHLTVMADFVPQVTVSGTLTACGNETATLSLTGTYHDYLWSTGDTTATITVGSAGYYWVTIGDGDGCTSVSEPVHLGVSELVSETPALCMVGVEDQHNLVVWEPLADSDVAEYRLYRENGQANIFEPLAVIPAGSGNAYADTTADPSVRAWRYKITAADTCGGETPMSALHKTVHLTINQGLGNSYNLIWTPYEGFEFASYRLYRGTANNNLQLIQTMPSTLTSFTDQNPAGDALFYQIEVVMDGNCVQETRDITFTGARSNIVYNGVPVATEVAVEACESYDWNGEVLTSSGEYTHSFHSVLGYDSVVTLHLTIHQPAASEFTVSCPDSCYTWNGTVYCASGDYTQTLQTVHGCDSVVTLHLTITVGIDDHDLAGSVKVFPNPANSMLNVQWAMGDEAATIELLDVTGKLLRTISATGETTSINVSSLADGMYFVRVTTEDGMVTKPFVVKR